LQHGILARSSVVHPCLAVTISAVICWRPPLSIGLHTKSNEMSSEGGVVDFSPTDLVDTPSETYESVYGSQFTLQA
jgi:hypothetical protein